MSDLASGVPFDLAVEATSTAPEALHARIARLEAFSVAVRDALQPQYEIAMNARFSAVRLVPFVGQFPTLADSDFPDGCSPTFVHTVRLMCIVCDVLCDELQRSREAMDALLRMSSDSQDELFRIAELVAARRRIATAQETT